VRRLRFLLQPGWIALVVGVIIFSGACFWILSPWQFGRNAERSAQNSEVTSAVDDSAVPLRQLVPVGIEPAARDDWREVTLSGSFQPTGETVARLRQVQDQPAYEILTPFRTDDGRIMLVDRGWVSPNNGQVPAYAPAPTGHFTLTARLHPEESNPHRPPLTEQGHREVYSINTTVVSNVTGLSVDPGYFTLVSGQPGVLNELPLPQVDSGPFLSYALQWIVFGVMALFGLGYFTRRELQPGGALTPEGRARRRAEKAALAAEVAKAVGGTPQPVPDEPEAAPPPPSPERVRGRKAVARLIAEDEAREREAAQSHS
jgi:cytochrome oxidase assembly protein ShyY1